MQRPSPLVPIPGAQHPQVSSLTAIPALTPAISPSERCLVAARLRLNWGHLRAKPVDESVFRITFEELQEHFHMPLAQVARKFGVGTTFMKKKCRKHGIKRWPFRKVNSLSRPAP